MSAVGFAIHSFDGTSIPPHCLAGIVFPASIQLTQPEAFAFCCKYQTLEYDINASWTDGVNTVPFIDSGSILVEWLDASPSLTERDIRTQTEITFQHDGTVAGVGFVLQLTINEYAGGFLYNIGVSGGLFASIPGTPDPVTSFGGSGSLISAVLLGQSIGMSDSAGTSSGTITVTFGTHFPYDPGDGGGPCWDSAGNQLRDPLPNTF